MIAREHCIHRLTQGTGRADLSNMAKLTFQPRCDMATGILLELDKLGETNSAIGIKLGDWSELDKLGDWYTYSHYSSLFSLFSKE